ncbi:uncharacterized protein THITE_2107393 [Thermothielavioides terrestris NRRL 8126]|uniref:Alb1-domain-containing protein n=1 Tax=Thermothielavioides terrestris (strain ATCC 38088 / NRRL 8126) TaxID=578455 RepID=G2QTT2_THETT|nr:uncharacterized protein THITE_2107393 [Thermothielavioides terrestris NRRL 8126]AEO62792.1 hypothetical protein THITE_2107393 [Thermothielavioides terrestris NRRL 8126]
MAKGNISKGKKAPSIHSRAARRATSPSIDTDKSLKHVRPPQESVDRRPAVLAAHHSGGVTKKAKSGRKAVLSSRARRRQEKSMDRAEAVMERTALKVQKSKDHAKVIHSRKKTWDEINREVFQREEQPKLSKKAWAKMQEDAMVAAFYADEDGDAEMEGAEVAAKEPSGVSAVPAQQATPPAPPPDDDEEEVL